jgi:hypothetical protein
MRDSVSVPCACHKVCSHRTTMRLQDVKRAIEMLSAEEILFVLSDTRYTVTYPTPETP